MGLSRSALTQDRLQHILKLQPGVISSESDDPATFRLQIARTRSISRHAHVVNRSVDFNHEPGCGAVEVGDKRTDRCLSPELVPVELLPP